MNDTPEEIRKKQLEIMMSMPEGVRIRNSFEMTELSREIIRGRIRAANPEISEAELNVELFRTFYRSDFDEQTMLRIVNSMREYHRSKDSTGGKSENQES